jgi:hypothetical protein
MAISYQEFLKKTNAEEVCDQLIVGVGPTRKMIGFVKDGSFTITDEGHALLAELDGQTAEAPKRRRKSETEDKPEVDAT